MTLDKAFEVAYQVEQALKTVSDPRYAEGLSRIHDMLERAVEFRDQMAGLQTARVEAQHHYDLLISQAESLREDISRLTTEKAKLEAEIEKKKQAIGTLRREAADIASN